ncbi:MAG: VWA domain-containing protein [Acidobacteria bacterium]|nr:VWA domain-containing protein [Acidobacteriota bacterium]
MHRKTFLSLGILWCATVSAFYTSAAFAQSADRERPRPEDFGSSLKRLKWDSQKKIAVDARRKSEGGKGSDEEDLVRVETSLVVSDFLVLDPQGRPVQGLTRGDFAVSEDDKPQQIGVFAPGDDDAAPRSVVFVIDASSEQSGFVRTSIEAAKSLVDGLGPRDRMAVVTDEIKLLTDFTQDRRELKEKLDSLARRLARSAPSGRADSSPRGAHYSALLATLNELFADTDRRPVIIFQANGNEASLLQNSIVGPIEPPADLPRAEREKWLEFARRERQWTQAHLKEFSLDDVYRAAERSPRATIYTVIPGLRLLGLPPDEQARRAKEWTLRSVTGIEDAKAADRSEVRRHVESEPEWLWKEKADALLREQTALAVLSRITGGWTEFLEEPSQAVEIYSRILSDVNSRYVVGYYPSNKAHDGTRRRIKIEVRGHPEYGVLGRTSYIAPPPEQ